MGQLTDQPFRESCCDGGQCSTIDSCQPCGCDPKAKWICAIHQQQENSVYKNARSGNEPMLSKREESEIMQAEVMRKATDRIERGNNWETTGVVRVFESGATRDSDEGKLDFEAFESPLVTKRFAEYMHEHRIQPDGKLRAGDNWQKGIDKDAYAKSLSRHVQDFKLHHRGLSDEAVDPEIESTLCAILFNVKGYLLEVLKERRLAEKVKASLA